MRIGSIDPFDLFGSLIDQIVGITPANINYFKKINKNIRPKFFIIISDD